MGLCPFDVSRVEKYNANVIGLILVVIPYAGITALMCPVEFMLFMIGIDYLLC